MRTENQSATLLNELCTLHYELCTVLAAADEVNYFDFIGVGNIYRFPIFFSNDVFIEFDGDAFGRKFESFEKFEQIQFAFEFTRFAVDKNLHFLFMFDRSS